jgi:hypothetical protein
MVRKSDAYDGARTVPEIINDSESEVDGDYDVAVSVVKPERNVDGKRGENERVYTAL